MVTWEELLKKAETLKKIDELEERQTKAMKLKDKGTARSLGFIITKLKKTLKGEKNGKS